MGRLQAGKKSRLKVYEYRDAVTLSFMDILSTVQREKKREREKGLQVSGGLIQFPRRWDGADRTWNTLLGIDHLPREREDRLNNNAIISIGCLYFSRCLLDS